MQRRLVLLSLLSIAGVALLGALGVGQPASAQETITLRLATLAPTGSSWHRGFQAWAGSVEQDSGGRLRLQFFYGGTQGDERDYVRKMEQGQRDGAAVTTTGLSQMVRPVLVLAAPGVFREYAPMDRARRQLASRFASEFESAGYHFIDWGDIGQARFFSKRPIRRPQDLRQTRPWARPDDPIINQFYTTIGATPQRLGVNELLPGLQTGRVDAFPSPSLAAVSLQWYQHATHVTEQPSGVVIGATVITQSKYESLPEDLRGILDSTGDRAHALLARSIRRADERAFEAITSRGVTAVDTSAHQAAWDEAAASTRQALAGRLYPAALLQQVEQVAGVN